MKEIPHLRLRDFGAWAPGLSRPHHEGYYAMYSSVYGGMVTEPVLMLVPADDHLVHRGDGVFETLKCVDGALYNLERHLDRLYASGEAIGLAPPCSREELRAIVLATVRAGGRHDASVRVLVSRGPGSLGVNPYDCPRPQLYVIAAALAAPKARWLREGATARFSRIPVKAGFFANIKSCNYLPNVLMKKEAIDAGVDFVLSLDEQDGLGEAPAESAAVVNAAGELLIPEGRRILPGTTMDRVALLAQTLVQEGLLTGVAHRDIPRKEVLAARELLVIGTTPDALSIVELEGQPVGNGQPGPVAARLAALLRQDMRDNTAARTTVFG